jgi:cell pole-organizing protein PopZ
MDEILASIRRIISEDDQSATDPKPQSRLKTLELDETSSVEAGDASTGEAAADTADEQDDAEEDHAMATATPNADAEAAPAAEVDDPLDQFDEPQSAAPAAEKAPEKAASARASGNVEALARRIRDEGLVGHAAATAASDSFGQLEQNVRVASSSSRTIEDIVEAMLAPMVREWLDANLPRIVEEKVEEEVRRIARRR